MKMPRLLISVLMIAVIGTAALGCGGAGVSQTDYQALQSQLTTTQQSVTDLQSQMVQLNADLAAARAENADLKGQLADAGGQTSAADFKALQQQYDASVAQVDTLTAQLADATAAYNTAKAQNNSYVAQIADLQQQVDELSATPTTVPPLPLTADNIKTMLWDRINQERVDAGLSQLQTGSHLAQWAAQHVQQMADVQHTTTFTDAVVGVQAAFMAVGYLSVSETVDATILFWKISPAWFTSIFLQPSITFGGVAVLQVGSVYYISFMGSNVP